MSQWRMVPSVLAVKSSPSVDEKQTSVTKPSCPANVATNPPFSVSQTLAVRSLLPQAIRFPLAEIATEITAV